jgi:hypothetical protein
MSSDEFATLVLKDASGNSGSMVLPGAGGVIRVAVGEPYHRCGWLRIGQSAIVSRADIDASL